MSNPYLSLILPAHNEAKRLPQSLNQVNEFVKQQPYECEVLVVENASTDDTAKIAEDFRKVSATKTDQVGTGGKGSYPAGMLAARRISLHGGCRFSMPVNQISRFMPPNLPQTHVAIASREQPGSKRIGEPFTAT